MSDNEASLEDGQGVNFKQLNLIAIKSVKNTKYGQNVDRQGRSREKEREEKLAS